MYREPNTKQVRIRVNFTTLFVDDDEHLIASFKRNIHSKEITILTARNGVEALSLLQNNRVQVLITDIRMPQMDGIELISKVADAYPDIIRIAISGEANMEDIKQLINRGHIWQYLEKPFSMGYIFVILKNAYTLYLERQERRELILKLDRKTKELEDLNNTLEVLVSERTKQLTQRTNILHMIVNGAPLETICNETARAICQKVKVDNVIIHSPHLSIPFSLAPIPLPDTIDNSVKQVITSQKEYIDDFYISLPLLQNSETIGVITVHTTDHTLVKNTQIRDTIAFFSPLLTMSLSHRQMLTNLPDLMDNIDHFLGSLENE